MIVVFVVTTAIVVVLEEEHMVCLDQQHSGKEGRAIVVVEDLSISDLDDSFILDCICCLKSHNYSVVVGFASEEVYYKCFLHKLQALATGADFGFMAS